MLQLLLDINTLLKSLHEQILWGSAKEGLFVLGVALQAMAVWYAGCVKTHIFRSFSGWPVCTVSASLKLSVCVLVFIQCGSEAH